MITNTQIQTAFYALLAAETLGYRITYPGRTNTPPESGYWLVVDFFPGNGIQNGIANSSSILPEGLFQVSAYTRPNSGIVGLSGVADEIISAFPKGTVLVDPVRISRTPYQSPRIDLDDRIMIPVTIPYSA